MNNLDDLNKGWVIGFLEGEGSFIAWKSSKKYLYAKVQVLSTEEESLLKLQALIGGTINGPYQSSHSTVLRNTKTPKPYWTWRISKQKEVLNFMNDIKPYLSKRRQKQIENIFSKLQEN